MMEENTKKARLLLSFVADNSASVSDERLAAFMQAFRAFAKAHGENTAFEYELIVFDGLSPFVAKGFTDSEIAPISGGRFPMLARATDLACDRIAARAAALSEAGEEVHRPCLFILTDGFSVDRIEETARRLDAMEAREQLLYLPFCLSDAPLSEHVGDFDRIKHLIRILPDGIEGFFAFVTRLVEERTALPVGEALKLSRSDFEGWTQL